MHNAFNSRILSSWSRTVQLLLGFPPRKGEGLHLHPLHLLWLRLCCWVSWWLQSVTKFLCDRLTGAGPVASGWPARVSSHSLRILFLVTCWGTLLIHILLYFTAVFPFHEELVTIHAFDRQTDRRTERQTERILIAI